MRNNEDKVTLTYPIAIRQGQEAIKKLLKKVQGIENEMLLQLWGEEILSLLSASCRDVDSGRAWKVLENKGVTISREIPSRIRRGILEIVGRNLRQQADRKEMFDSLTSISKEPEKWDYKLLVKNKSLYKKSAYIVNLSEQVSNFVKKEGRYPKDYFELQKAPQLKNPILTYSADDGAEKGQAIRYKQEGNLLLVSLKGLNGHYRWNEVTLELPEVVSEKLSCGCLVAPELRLKNLGGQFVPILDVKVEFPKGERKKTGRFLVVDWGVKKLITLTVFDEDGDQISRPIFLRYDGIRAKLYQIRVDIDNIKRKRDKFKRGSTRWRSYNRLIAQRWRKFRCLQEELSHLASSAIALIGKIYDCDRIYIEWLKGLKARDFGRRLNWKINSTVRSRIFKKLEYKCQLLGLSLEKPLNPKGSSQYCPKCGRRGRHYVESNCKVERKSGGWFKCLHCGYQGDRDYVATQAFARKVLCGSFSTPNTKGISYMLRPAARLLRQSGRHVEKLAKVLNGWKHSCYLRPLRL